MVLGRARYSFGNGFWDQWYLEMGSGTMMWLSEDNHELALQKQHTMEVAIFEHYTPGTTLQSGKTTFMVQEVGNAECIGIEGDLPKLIEMGETYPYVGASSLDGRYILSVEYDEEKPSAFIGRWLKYAQLRVSSRTSSFIFKGENIDIPTVAERLGVTNVLEGSVRRAGNRIRITAQLIDTETDSHLWSETYDRGLMGSNRGF